jgi:hypothetical protein
MFSMCLVLNKNFKKNDGENQENMRFFCQNKKTCKKDAKKVLTKVEMGGILSELSRERPLVH